jgi:two-component system NarL family response regulator
MRVVNTPLQESIMADKKILAVVGATGAQGGALVRAILADRPSTSIVFLTVFDADEGLFAAIRGGAKGYVLKDVSVTELLAFVRASARGEPALAPALNSRLLGEFARSGGRCSDHDGDPALTQRELEVLRELSTGASNDEIAHRLVISLSTVKNHLHNILTKLQFHNRREAIQYARSRSSSPHAAELTDSRLPSPAASHRRRSQGTTP